MVYKFKNPAYFSEWEKPDFKQFNGNLVLWGAGKVGGVAAHCLKKLGVEYAAVCDISKDKRGTTFCEHKVISPEDLKKDYPDAAVIISNVFHNSIQPQLLEDGFTKIFDCSSLFMEIDFDEYDFWMTPEYAIRNIEQYLAAILEQKTRSNVIDQVFLNITTKCTLRCKECAAFIPYISAPENYDSKIILEDFYKVLDTFNNIRIVNFYGGEPFLHPELAFMIRSLANEERIDRISTITNGTILPNSELINAMKEEKRLLVRISDYGKLSTKLDELKDIFDKNNIKYEVANFTYWDQTSKIGNMNYTEEKLVEKFKLCTACNVLIILNRKLTLCITGSALCNIGTFPESENNYVDLSQNYESTEKLQQKILDFFEGIKKGNYIDACKYCSGNHCVQFENKVPVAEQTKELLVFKKLH